MVQAHKLGELGELERRCKALLDERSRDKGQLKGLREENQKLSAENAYVQQAYYELDHSSRPLRASCGHEDTAGSLHIHAWAVLPPSLVPHHPQQWIQIFSALP